MEECDCEVLDISQKTLTTGNHSHILTIDSDHNAIFQLYTPGDPINSENPNYKCIHIDK